MAPLRGWVGISGAEVLFLPTATLLLVKIPQLGILA